MREDLVSLYLCSCLLRAIGGRPAEVAAPGACLFGSHLWVHLSLLSQHLVYYFSRMMMLEDFPSSLVGWWAFLPSAGDYPSD